MATPKPMGIKKKEFEESQLKKAEEDFKYETNQRLQQFQFAMNQLDKNLADSVASQKSCKVGCDIQISRIMESTMNSLKEFRAALDDFEKLVKENTAYSRKAVDVIQNDYLLKSEFATKTSDNKQTFDNLHKQIESFKGEFLGLLQRQYNDFDVKLKALKEEILSIPSEIPEMKKVFDQKIELAELNGQNALLRSSNNERQLQLIEKKIENLYQLIKKIEITNQESK